MKAITTGAKIFSNKNYLLNSYNSFTKLITIYNIYIVYKIKILS